MHSICTTEHSMKDSVMVCLMYTSAKYATSLTNARVHSRNTTMRHFYILNMTHHPKRKVHLSRHHLTCKQRFGRTIPSNILMLWRDSHDYWHMLFGNRTLDEILCFLLNNSRELQRKKKTPTWKKLFKEKTELHVYRILRRVKKIKHKA